MSVLESDKVDAMGVRKESEDTLCLLIIDHLPWIVEEYEHIKILQKKLNAYISFIRKKGYFSSYKRDFDKFVINIDFKYQYTENFEKFIASGRQQLKAENINVRYKYVNKK